MMYIKYIDSYILPYFFNDSKVIYKYKEFEFSHLKYKISESLVDIFDGIKSIINENQKDISNTNNIEFLNSPHVIDLHKDGYIGIL